MGCVTGTPPGSAGLAATAAKFNRITPSGKLPYSTQAAASNTVACGNLVDCNNCIRSNDPFALSVAPFMLRLRGETATPSTNGAESKGELTTDSPVTVH